MWLSTARRLQRQRVSQARKKVKIGTSPGGHPSLERGQPLTHKEASVALSRVIRTLSFPILKLSALQGEGDYVLGWGRDSESEMQKVHVQMGGGLRVNAALTT